MDGFDFIDDDTFDAERAWAEHGSTATAELPGVVDSSEPDFWVPEGMRGGGEPFGEPMEPAPAPGEATWTDGHVRADKLRLDEHGYVANDTFSVSTDEGWGPSAHDLLKAKLTVRGYDSCCGGCREGSGCSTAANLALLSEPVTTADGLRPDGEWDCCVVDQKLVCGKMGTNASGQRTVTDRYTYVCDSKSQGPRPPSWWVPVPVPPKPRCPCWDEYLSARKCQDILYTKTGSDRDFWEWLCAVRSVRYSSCVLAHPGSERLCPTIATAARPPRNPRPLSFVAYYERVSIWDLLDDYYYANEMVRAKNWTDKMAHCWLSCRIAKAIGPTGSLGAGIGKELWDLIGPGEASLGDLAADTIGVLCAGFGRSAISPIPSKSCRECCEDQGMNVK